MEARPLTELRLFTIGHSIRSFKEFKCLFEEFQIQVIADVRRYPSSPKFPHFNRGTPSEWLETEGIQHLWMESLRGLRHTGRDKKSPNMGLRSPAFRNYAHHMMKEKFQDAAKNLLVLSRKEPTAIRCAERFFWKCHRRLLSDFLVARGATVAHIMEPGNLRLHTLTTGAFITEEGGILYPEPVKAS